MEEDAFERTKETLGVWPIAMHSGLCESHAVNLGGEESFDGPSSKERDDGSGCLSSCGEERIDESSVSLLHYLKLVVGLLLCKIEAHGRVR